MDVIITIFKPVVDILTNFIKKEVGFITSYKKDVKNMGNKMAELNVAKVDCEEHKNRNKSNNLEIPSQVDGWLEDVRKVDEKVERICATDVRGCSNLNNRRKLGKQILEIIGEIESVATKNSLINWTDNPIPLAKVASRRVSTSTPQSDHGEFESREQTFRKALEALDSKHKSHMVALCGMGGVGKTTMMEKVKKVLEDERKFDYIIKVVVGEKTDPNAIQRAVADFIEVDLKESTKEARSEKLRTWFKNNSDGGKKRFLVILDDIWQFVDMNDIGLSPLPNQGVNFKVLLTSRFRDVCRLIGVEANLVLDVEVLETPEAQSLFLQFVKDPNDAAVLDHNFKEIGDDIVLRCQGLPIAIKIIASTLKGKSIFVWEDAREHLHHNNIDEVLHQVFKTSYVYLKEEAKSVFLLCGLYPEDFDIPMEELMRYGRGLELFNEVYHIRGARNRLIACIEQLMDANLLIKSDHFECIKIHDLVRAFILKMFSEVKHANLIVNNGDTSEWPKSIYN